jgi:EAL domain-containing protein (putative c-di-GMP-specific phosphodiesterase class I)
MIKVDKNFFKKAMSDKKDRVLLECLLSLTQKLNIMVIFSEIEEEKELEYIDMLKDNIGVSGYYYTKPLSLEELNKITF